MENYTKTPTAFFKLPPNIQNTIRRKSSRDPSSQFTTKLHVLLSFTSNNPTLEEEIGIGWITNNKFRMNKKTLVDIMGIKINTMNVNLKDLNFKQLQRDKEGWTQWSKEGFTKTNLEIPHPVNEKKPQPKKITYPFSIGVPFNVSNDYVGEFFTNAQNLWEEIIGCQSLRFKADDFIYRTAVALKQNGQTLDNAESVLQALIAPYRADPEYIEMTDFIRFLAMFGPKKTAMLKIASLLEYSNNTGNWLFFSRETPHNSFYASFCEAMPNCLVLHKRGGIEFRLYNIPTIEALAGDYIFDQNNTSYESWGDFFQKHPEAIENDTETYNIYQYTK
ncbi:39 kDa initiator binding protein [Histomonas meleagridis]|uniref:39 kDa initiator binding protein n=1 Tax=Histomonas meleagridis TaxID=135588 RepID=UPI00355A8339|nr:39 kDa initiator binding protein [Histomonas meleagridis]KAH0801180.1 39 kDa initiator binding protein [Histomonas meleagridis]